MIKRPSRKTVVESDVDGGRVREGKLGGRYRGREREIRWQRKRR